MCFQETCWKRDIFFVKSRVYNDNLAGTFDMIRSYFKPSWSNTSVPPFLLIIPYKFTADFLVEILLPLKRFWGPTIGGIWHCGRGPLIPCWYLIIHPAWEHVLYWDCLDLEAHTDSVGWSLIFVGTQRHMSRTFPPSRGCECWSYPGWDPEFAIRFSTGRWQDLERFGMRWCLNMFFLRSCWSEGHGSYHVTKFADPALVGYLTAEVLTPHGLLSCPQERDETWKPMKRKGFSWQGAIEVFVWTSQNMATLGYIWHLYAVFT